MDTVITVAGLGVPQGIRCGNTFFLTYLPVSCPTNHSLSARKISLAQYL